MCRLLGYVARSPRSLHDLLGETLASFTALSRRHGHGWGIATHDGRGGVRVVKEPGPAHTSRRYAEEVGATRADAGIVHLRWASMNLAIGPGNTHPFSDGRHAFAHNGSIWPIDRIEELIDPPRRALLRGTTDSERYFLAVRSALEHAGPVEAVHGVVAAIRERLSFSSLNATLLTPDALLVVAVHDPRVGAQKDEIDAFHLRWRVTPEAVVVASSGWAQDGWTSLENGRLLVVERASLATRVVDLSRRPDYHGSR
jgi:predicted glutamine amidotransferase